MLKVFPKGFRDDVVCVAQNRDAEVMLVQIAKDFGVRVGILDKWLREARVVGGEQFGVTRSERDEMR